MLTRAEATSRAPVIVHVVQHLERGGIEAYALALAAAAGDRLRTRLVSLEGDGTGFAARFPEYASLQTSITWFGKQPGPAPMLAWRLARHLRRIGASTVATHHLGPLLYGGLAARIALIPNLVHTVHDLWHLDDGSTRRLETACVRGLRPVVVAQAQTSAERLRGLWPAAAVTLLPTGIDLKRFRPLPRAICRERFDLPAGVPLLGCAARLVPEKGIDLVLRALATLPAAVHLVIAGDGPDLARLTALAEELGLQERVRFLGPVADMPVFFGALDLLVLASMREGLPLSLLEAQACGCPVVASAVGMAAEAVCSVTGAVVPGHDPDALAQTIAAQLRRQPGDPRRFLLGRDLNATALRYAALGVEARTSMRAAPAGQSFDLATSHSKPGVLGHDA